MHTFVRGTFKQFALMRKASVRTARKADLRPRRLFDFVSPAIVGTAIVLYVAVVLLVLYIRQNPFPGFGGYMNIVAVTAMNLFLAGMIIVTLYGKKADPYQAYGDRLRLIEMNVRTLVPGFPISLWYLTARTSRRALISGAPRKEPHYGG